MRAAVLLVVLVGLFASGHSADLLELGKGLATQLVNSAKDALTTIGKNLLSSLLGSIGKRDIGVVRDWIAELTSKFHGLLDHGKQLATSAFGKAIEKLRTISDKFHAGVGLLKDDVDDVKNEVDDVVAEHRVMHKRILADLWQKAKDLASAAVDKLKGFASALKGKASELVSGLLQTGVNTVLGKRATTLSDHLKTIGGAISSAVSPFKDIVAGLGNTLKGHFSNLVDTVKGHYNALKGKLSGHISDLKTHGQTLLTHGKNALGTLGEVVSDILKQTLSNAGPAIDGIAGALSGAGKTAVDHFSGADKTPASTF